MIVSELVVFQSLASHKTFVHLSDGCCACHICIGHYPFVRFKPSDLCPMCFVLLWNLSGVHRTQLSICLIIFIYDSFADLYVQVIYASNTIIICPMVIWRVWWLLWLLFWLVSLWSLCLTWFHSCALDFAWSFRSSTSHLMSFLRCWSSKLPYHLGLRHVCNLLDYKINTCNC